MSHSTRFHMFSTILYHLERYRSPCIFYRRNLLRFPVLGAFHWSSMLQTPTSERPLFCQLNPAHDLSRFTGSRFARMHLKDCPGTTGQSSSARELSVSNPTRLSLEGFIVPEGRYRRVSFAGDCCLQHPSVTSKRYGAWNLVIPRREVRGRLGASWTSS
ncbi:hypothetical protein FA13DRAFT_1138120 [Coprinellus micaceus]|uniref:Uncharacterized protein n=1 Tax=Coprinellus micaceus TaxID=71717 RepID=A0A4Y7RJD9_COPMI|nr:hypothetical protein FA13DRAFT_1138120 [Coprinellus micaceus]